MAKGLKFTFGAAVLAGALIASIGIAAADGGGGGGMSAPSGNDNASAPRNDPQAAYQAGVQALQAQNYREAIRQFRTARRAAPDSGVINYGLGLAYMGNNEPDDARETFERAARATDAPVGTRMQLGLVYLQLNRRDDAVAQQTALAEALAACGDGCDATRRAQLQAAHAQLTRALEAPAAADPATTGWNFPSIEEGRAAYAEAVGLINQERFVEAYASLERAQAAAGPHADIYNYMGFVSRKLGRYDAALAYYDQALDLDPAHLGATEYLGELYIQLGQMERARTQLARLDDLCAYGCAQREELALWIARAE